MDYPRPEFNILREPVGKTMQTQHWVVLNLH